MGDPAERSQLYWEKDRESVHLRVGWKISVRGIDEIKAGQAKRTLEERSASAKAAAERKKERSFRDLSILRAVLYAKGLMPAEPYVGNDIRPLLERLQFLRARMQRVESVSSAKELADGILEVAKMLAYGPLDGDRKRFEACEASMGVLPEYRRR